MKKSGKFWTIERFSRLNNPGLTTFNHCGNNFSVVLRNKSVYVCDNVSLLWICYITSSWRSRLGCKSTLTCSNTLLIHASLLL